MLVAVLSSAKADIPESDDYIIDGSDVYIDTPKAYIRAPGEIHGSGWTHLNFIGKQFSGDIDLALGFDTTHLIPKKAEFYNPHFVYTSHTMMIYNVTDYELHDGTAALDVGEYNAMNNKYFTISYSRPIYDYVECDNSSGICPVSYYMTETLTTAFDSTSLVPSEFEVGEDYSITWYTERTEDWIDITDKFGVLPESIHNNYDNKNKWYYVKDQPIIAGTEYQIRIYVEAPPQLGAHQYKYDVVIKPSSQDFAQAISNGNLFVLDPYFNTSWNNRISNQLPDGVRPYLYSLNISNGAGTNNATHIFGDGKFNSNYSDIVITYGDGTIIPHAIEDNSSDPTVLWANVTNNGNVYIYYNNSNAIDTSNFSAVVSGGVISGSNGNIIHSFLSNGTFSPFGSFDVEYLVIAGGGGGAHALTGYTGGRAGGGGGAGGFLTDTGHSVTAQDYSIIVGEGGDGTYGVSSAERTGKNSTFDTINSVGGGRGGAAGGAGGPGGSGGGAGRNSATEAAGVPGQGNDGGKGVLNTQLDAGAGGAGGKGEVGQAGTTSYGGDGGDGIQSSITGTAIYYGGGGGGSRYNGDGGTGGLGGGGDGQSGPGDGEDGTANTGGGGGGSVTRYEGNKNGGDGGSGTIIISYSESGTWSTWSEEHFYTDSLHYNTTSPYNHTIESDATLTANRSITAADDTDDTAKSTGTSHLIINVFDNEASIVRNFTFTGDDLDWYQAANLSGSYDLKNAGGIIETQSDGNFTTNLAPGTYWIEETIPEYIPPNPITLENTAGNFWVNFTWSPGSGNVTDNYNVSYNGTWDNTSSNAFRNESVGAHGHLNITVYAYNNSGDGTLSAGYITDNVTVPNNVPVLSGVSASYNLYENETLIIDAEHIDLDGDTITYSDNASEWDINSVTGEVSWGLDWGDVGVHPYRITINDGHGGTDYQDFTVTVTGMQNTALTSVDTSFDNGTPGSDFTDNTITLSFYLINSGSIDADVSAKFITNQGAIFGLINGGSNAIGGSNFKLGNSTLDALLDTDVSVDLTDDIPGEDTQINYEVQLRVPAGQSAIPYSGTVELTFSEVL